MSYFDINNAGFNPELRMLETTDPVHADVFNDLFGQLIKNDVAIMRSVAGFADSKNKQAEFLLNMRKDACLYGVHWDPFSATPSPVGTRILDNVGKVCQPSTDSVRGRNDLENTSVFFHLEVNGHMDETGEFQVEAIRGVDDTFDRFEKDVWCLFNTQWIKIEITSTGENKILSDTKFDGSFPEGGAIRPDGTVRPFVAIAKYQDSSESSGTPNSLSGKVPSYNLNHNTLITKMHRKGNQYCATSFQDWERMNNLMDVAFATRNSQAIMYGACNYYYQYQAVVQEADVERIIITKAQAKNLVVGSCVSIGNANALSSGNPNNGRGQAGMHAKANRVLITRIDDYDADNAAVYVDNGGVKFSTASTVVDGVSCPTFISTMPWWTGSTDPVLGTCGSLGNNTDGKHPYVLFGVEYALGQYEVCGNAKMDITNGVMRAALCYDSTKLSGTKNAPGYVLTNYSLALTDNGWKYISVLGFDADNPMARYGTEVDASSSTGYCDGQHTGNVSETTNDQREILLGGNLNSTANAGRRCASLGNGLPHSDWGYAARLSASGLCGQKTA